MKWNHMDATLLRFLLIGLVNTAVGCGTMFLLYNLAGCSYWISTTANYIMGGIVSFFLNKHFTFRNHERSWKQAVKFASSVIICYFVAYGLAKPIVCQFLSEQSVKVQENFAMLSGAGIYTTLNYLGQRYLVFRHTDQ